MKVPPRDISTERGVLDWLTTAFAFIVVVTVVAVVITVPLTPVPVPLQVIVLTGKIGAVVQAEAAKALCGSSIEAAKIALVSIVLASRAARPLRRDANPIGLRGAF